MTIQRLFVVVAIFSALAFAPVTTYAANANFFGPIISEECKCEGTAPDWGCVLQTVQNTVNLGISLGVMFAVLIIAYAGFLFMTSSVNAHNREMARTVLLHAVIGLVIALSAWLIVDFVMKALYNEDSQFGPWNTILSGGNYCIQTSAPPTGSANSGNGGVTGSSTGGGSNCPAADASGMVAFPAEATSGETERATPATVQNFMAMRAAALADGIDLKVTDGYRSDSEQTSLWNTYCSSGQCSRPVAKPCALGGNGSNHNSGLAVDIAVGCNNGQSGCNTPTYNWLKTHGSQWHFTNALPTDPVHWSPSGH